MFDDLPPLIQLLLPLSAEQIELLERIYEGHHRELIALLVLLVTVVLLRLLPLLSVSLLCSSGQQKREPKQELRYSHSSKPSFGFGLKDKFRNTFTMPAASPQTVCAFIPITPTLTSLLAQHRSENYVAILTYTSR